MFSKKQLSEDIVKIVKNEKGRPIPVKIIYEKLKYLYKNKYEVFSVVDQLVQEKTLKSLFNNKIVMGYENGPLLHETSFEGTIFLNNSGDGFVKKLDTDESEIYINNKNVNSALSGDKVIVCLMDKQPFKKGALKDGVVLKVIERNKDFFTGLFVKKNNSEYSVIFDDEKNKLKVVLDDTNGLVDGHKILVKIANIKDGIAYGSVSKILGHINSVGIDILSMVYDAGLEPEFSDEINNNAKKINKIIDEKEFKSRVDLTHLNIITIDPATSKDLDDAIYVEKNNNGYKLYVCIADVAHYVRPNSLIDNEAYTRGTSVYLINQVIPMLPHNLSNDICSLNPNENRLSMVCEMDINEQGDFTKINVYNAVIRSKRRFSYQEVNDFFDQKNQLNNDNEQIKNMLHIANKLFLILQNKREKLGYIHFDIKEPSIKIDENQKIIEITHKLSGVAQNMIEAFMVCANEAVTLKFNELKLNPQFIYRIHDVPDQKKIDLFEIEADKLNFIFNKNDLNNLKPNTISGWLKKNKNNPNQELINLILLRTMAKAKYSDENIGHFGLALSNYTHFTSPIRRYADLIVHRMFKMFYLSKNEYSDQQRIELNNKIDDICKQATKTEIIATNVERDVNSMKFAEYMENKIGHEYKGFASYITNFGIFVQLENTIEGLIRPINIKDDFYEYDESNACYIGKKFKKTIRLGTKLIVKVVGAQKNTKKIDFELVKFI